MRSVFKNKSPKHGLPQAKPRKTAKVNKARKAAPTGEKTSPMAKFCF